MASETASCAVCGFQYGWGASYCTDSECQRLRGDRIDAERFRALCSSMEWEFRTEHYIGFEADGAAALRTIADALRAAQEDNK